MTRKKTIQWAVFAALGCTKFDYRSPKRLDEAAGQVAEFVEAALKAADAQKEKDVAAIFKEEPPQWVKDYEAQLMSDAGHGAPKPTTE